MRARGWLKLAAGLNLGGAVLLALAFRAAPAKLGGVMIKRRAPRTSLLLVGDPFHRRDAFLGLLL